MSPASSRANANGARRRIRIGEIDIDRVTFVEAIEVVEALVESGRGGTVFTPNVDHVVLAEEEPMLREAYAAADLAIVDGMPLLWAARILGAPFPEKISGSDFVVPLTQRIAERGWRIYLLGGAEGVAERAKSELERLAPGVKIVGTSSPRIATTGPADRHDAIVEELRRAQPDVVFLALGAPKQEIFAHQIRVALPSVVFVGIGGTLDFLVGTQKRAPPWMSRAGLEWLYRLSNDPRRLWKRYLVRDPKFVFVFLRTLRAAR